MNHLVLQNRTDLTNLNFNVYIQSEPGVGLKRNLVWNQAGGTWDTSVENHPWLNNGQNAFFILGDQVTFGDAGVGPVAVAPAGIAPDSMRVQNSSGNYIFSGGPIGGSTSLEKSGGGVLTLANTNTYTGDTIILAGTLALDAQGQISPVSLITNDATFQILSGDHTVGAIMGNGSTEVDSGSLTVSSIAQDTLAIGPGDSHNPSDPRRAVRRSNHPYSRTLPLRPPRHGRH